MLKLKNVCKYYNVGKSKKIILDNITLDFKDRELVFILGASGSGKSTLLNIIGGNLSCDSGEMWLDGECITNYSDKELDNYRSSIIGNIFQDYNLIDYMNVIDNIMLGYNYGLTKKEIDVLLKQLGIYSKKNVIVNKLSGGEKQRVAIARALVNNPDIILADEPTGALDSQNGLEVMEILKKISNNKLVIVVSHDNNLANKYATRIINIKDGKCNYDEIKGNSFIVSNFIKKKNNIKTILKLALRNLWLKKTRTIFTSLAISLGIISMSLVINLYSNFNSEINKLESDIVSVFPITISNDKIINNTYDFDKTDGKIGIKSKENIYINKIDDDYIDYIKNIKEIKYINYGYDMFIPIISDTFKIVDNNYLKAIPAVDYINDNYEVLYGRNIKNKNEILLKVDINNNVDSELFNSLNINSEIDFNNIIGRKIKIINNNDYYIKNGNYYVINENNNEMYNKSNIELSIVGIVKEKEEADNNNYLYCDNSIINDLIDINKNSDIVKSQITSNYNVLGIDMDKDMLLKYLGYELLPSSINIYVDNLKDKKVVIDKLDEYNSKFDKVIYVDTMAEAIDIVRNFISIISIILILFSIIAIIISSLMIGILTNVRVLERKKEIGILRSVGISKSEVRKVFDIENIFIGIISFIIGFIIINMMVKPINDFINNYMGIDNIFIIKYNLILLVFIINILIIKLSGSIPALKASKMDIVKCIYNR